MAHFQLQQHLHVHGLTGCRYINKLSTHAISQRTGRTAGHYHHGYTVRFLFGLNNLPLLAQFRDKPTHNALLPNDSVRYTRILHKDNSVLCSCAVKKPFNISTFSFRLRCGCSCWLTSWFVCRVGASCSSHALTCNL
jgi:hypothetical protein